MTPERYRVVVGFELTAADADAAYAAVLRLIAERNAAKMDSDLKLVIGPLTRTGVYVVGGNKDAPQVTPRPLDESSSSTPVEGPPST